MLVKSAPHAQPMGMRSLISGRFIILLTFLAFITFSDALLSYWVPGHIEAVTQNAIAMGLIMSISSIMGFFVDLYFPQLLRATSIKRLMLAAIAVSLGFISLLLFTTLWPYVALLVFAVALWGIYYELIAFTNALFVAHHADPTERARGWGIVHTVKNFAYFAGPLFAAFLFIDGKLLLITAATLTLVSIIAVFGFVERNKTVVAPIKHQRISLFTETRRWVLLFRHIWPIVILSFLVGCIDAIFWTTGTVWSQKLSEFAFVGGFLISAYTLPTLIGGIIIARLTIDKHKKKLAEFLTLISGIILIGVGFSPSIGLILLFVFASSILLSLAIPLIDAVYTDITTRMGSEQEHMVGLSNSTFSLAYVFGPILGGITTFYLGEQLTFAATGLVTAFVSLGLLVSTPKKLQLPQTEIKHWSKTTSARKKSK